MRIIALIVFLFSISVFGAETRCLEIFSYPQVSFLPGIDLAYTQSLVLPAIDRHFLVKLHNVRMQDENSSLAKSSLLGSMTLNLAANSGRGMKTVLYPSSGYDSGSAHLIFPLAETIIGIDNHAFIHSRKEGLGSKLQSVHDSYFSFVGDVEAHAQKNNMADVILGNLLVANPLIRILRVVHAKAQSGGSHGWIEFDQGPGTALQRYVHIQHLAPVNYVSPLFIEIANNGFDALLSKGAQRMFNQAYGALSGFFLVNRLKRARGVLVDTDGRVWEWERDWALRLGMDFRDYMEITGTDINLGYNHDGDNSVYPGTKVIIYNGKIFKGAQE